MKNPILKYALASFAALLLMAGLWLFWTANGHYAYCLMNEGRWMKAQSRGELEAMLHGCNRQPIDPAQSAWGHGYRLKDGETMIQYHILNDPTCPLDVVYDTNHLIQALFTSYE